MKTAMLLVSAAALALTAGSASAGAAHPTVAVKAPPSKHFTYKPHLGSTTLYDQSAGTNGIGIVSQNFTDFTSGGYNADGADDFVLSGKHSITAVNANGIYFNGAGPADSVNVRIYKKIKKGVGKGGLSCPSQAYSDLTGTGYFHVPLASCTGKNKFKKGWVSVSVNMAFSAGGEWGWNTNNTVNGKASVWENPGGNFGTGCATYTTTTTCIPSGEGGDFAFALYGN